MAYATLRLSAADVRCPFPASVGLAPRAFPVEGRLVQEAACGWPWGPSLTLAVQTAGGAWGPSLTLAVQTCDGLRLPGDAVCPVQAFGADRPGPAAGTVEAQLSHEYVGVAGGGPRAGKPEPDVLTTRLGVDPRGGKNVMGDPLSSTHLGPSPWRGRAPPRTNPRAVGTKLSLGQSIH